jgi:hypothetical protein
MVIIFILLPKEMREEQTLPPPSNDGEDAGMNVQRLAKRNVGRKQQPRPAEETNTLLSTSQRLGIANDMVDPEKQHETR